VKNSKEILEETEKLLSLTETVLNLNNSELKMDFPINELYIQLGHSDSVVTMDISPDGKYMVSGSLDKTIRLWDIESGEELKTFNLYDNGVSQNEHSDDDKIFSVTITADGKSIISGHSNTVIFDIESGEKLDISYKTFLRTNLNRNHIISENYNQIEWYDLESKETFKEIYLDRNYTKEFEVLAITVSEQYIVIASSYYSNYFELIDISTEETIQTFRDKTYIEPKQEEYEEDCTYYIKGAGDREMEEEAEIEALYASGNYRPSIDRNFYDSLFIITFDEKNVISITFNNTLSLWDIKNGEQLKVFSGHKSSINSIALTPNGKYIVSGSSDKTIKLWDIESAEELKSFIGHKDSINTVSVTPNGKYIISGSDDNTLKLWDIESGEALRSFGNRLLDTDKNNISISLDGQYIFNTLASRYYEYDIHACQVSDAIKYIWDIEDEKCLEHKIYNKGLNYDEADDYIDDYSLDKYCIENNIQLSNADDEKDKEIEFNKEKKLNPSFFKYEDRYREIDIDSIAINKNFLVVNHSYMYHMDHTKIVLWDKKTLKPLKTFKKYYGNENKVGISKNEKYIFSYDDSHNIKVVWDIETEETLENFESWNNYEIDVRISPNQKYLISLNRDSSIKIWDIETKEVLIYFIALSNKEWITWTNDGYYNCSDGVIKYISFLNNSDALPTIIDRENRIYKDRKKDNLFSLVLNDISGNILC